MNAVTGLVLRVLLFISLYAFLAVALWLFWKSLTGTRLRGGTIAIPTLTLATTIDEEQVIQTFTSSDVVVGRNPDCDLILVDETVSGRHGRLTYNLNQWWYEDLKSTNGSWLDDLKIEEPIVVKDNDSIYCGDAVFKVYIKPLK
ncbi:MAG: FHA domain-containing protein [Chloroflexi bacterium]|nr:FHA domain-containing protein [Chloroflexota bacterium]